MNTKIVYRYKDGNGFTVDETVIVAGRVTIAQLAEVTADSSLHFDPRMVGLASLKDRIHTTPVKPPNRWHKIVSLNKTEDDPTETRDAAGLLAAFTSAKAHNWTVTPSRNRRRRVNLSPPEKKVAPIA